MKTHKHSLVQVHLALAEFQVGDPEKGRAQFEEMLSKGPGRTDLWSVYIDAEAKIAEVDRARSLLERGVNLGLRGKRAKFMWQKYVQLEQRFGTE